MQNALIFCNRKRDVDILHKSLTRHKFDVGALHGDMAQTVRFATLEKFKANELRLLVCSDVAARGLDIGGLSHVFNFDVPNHAEDYVHRIGRTGRAGLEGHAFTIAGTDDRFAVEAIEKLIGHPIPPMIVEGLDPVDWTEEDGRKRRGRGVPPRGGPGQGPGALPRASPGRSRRRAPPPRQRPRRTTRRTPRRAPRPRPGRSPDPGPGRASSRRRHRLRQRRRRRPRRRARVPPNVPPGATGTARTTPAPRCAASATTCPPSCLRLRTPPAERHDGDSEA